MIDKTIFILAIILLAIFDLNAQTGQIQEGSVINGADGQPAGVVFQYDAQTGAGLMVSLSDTQLPWGAMGVNVPNVNDNINSAVALRDFAGFVNTSAIFAHSGVRTEYAARWCFELNAGGLTGWYLPSVGELHLLLSKRQLLNQTLQRIGATAIPGGWYWSSSEGNENRAWNVSGDNVYPANKNEIRRVRAIRKFYQ